MSVANLCRFLRPRSIAVFGGQAAAEVARQSEKIGFGGDIWPVHPRHEHVAGKRAFRSVGDLPKAPDAAFIGVNRHATTGIAAELAAVGCGGAVVFASGYAEAGAEGKTLQSELLGAAGDMPFLGPNCYGFVNALDRALVWPDQFGGTAVERGVAIIAQSGNIGLNLTMQRRALPIGMMITLGNMASVGHAAAMEAVLDDPRISAIGLHMEGVGEPQALAEAVARAHRQGVRVVAIKTGRSEEGASIALSHTASLSSSDAVVDAYFRRIGVARAGSLPAFLETLKLLHLQGALPGRRIASLSCSGGEAALIADAAEDAGVELMRLTAESRTAIGATLPDMVSIANPLDYHTFAWRNGDALAAIFAAMMRTGADLTLLILDYPRPDTCDTADWDIAANALHDAAQATGRRAGVLATLPECMPEAKAMSLASQGIVPLFGMVEALEAIAAASSFSKSKAPFRMSAALAVSPDQAQVLSEFEGKQRLAAFGVAVPRGRLANNTEAAVEAALQIGFPAAVKAVGAIAHKTDLGAVRLNLADAEAARAAAANLLHFTGTVLVEAMVRECVAELIVGVARDPVFGLYLVIGSGGILAELVGDTAILLLPVTREQIAEALGGLRVSRLLEGFRGAGAADTSAVIETILKVQNFAMAHETALAELDINPLMVCRNGAIAADVMMRMVEETDHD
jgi:acyl-CoA synthetase (NDP forming)